MHYPFSLWFRPWGRIKLRHFRPLGAKGCNKNYVPA